MRTALTITSTALAGVAPAASLAVPAEAASGYRDANCSGAAIGGTDAYNVGGLNDQISSVRTYGAKVKFWEDAGFLGRQVTLTGDYNYLRAIATNLHWGETWDDRISSWDTAPFQS